MKANWTKRVFPGFLLALSFGAVAQQPEISQSFDIAAIQEVRENLDTAYNRRDAIAFSELFTEDADFQWHTGEVLKSRKEIEQFFANSFSNMPADFRHITTFDRIRFISPEVAIGDGTVVIAGEGSGISDKPYMEVLLTCVGIKVRGEWYIAAVRLIPIIGE